MKLDKLDYEIMSYLRENSRITYKELAKKVHSNINTVASRIKRLERNKFILGYGAQIDYGKVGYPAGAFVRINLDSTSSLDKEILNGIISEPSTVLAYGMTGKYDICLITRAKSFDELLEHIGRIGKNKHITCMRSELIVKEYSVIEDFNPLIQNTEEAKFSKKRKKPLDELDFAILRELRNNGNAPLRVLSEKLKSPISTIKERSDRMHDEGIIKRYVALLNFPKLGFWGSGLIGIKLDSNRIGDEAIAEKIREIPEVGTLYRVLGEYDLYAGVLAKGVEHAVEIIKKVGSVPGVRSLEPHVGLSRFKSRTDYNPLSNFRMKREKN